MKVFLCLAALVVLAAAYPIAERYPHGPYYPSYEEKYAPERFGYDNRVPEVEYRDYNQPWGKAAPGDKACDRQALNPNDVISQKFYDDHICLIRGSPPSDLPAFCKDFRQGPQIYQVMQLNANDIGRLRSDLQGHQKDFYNDRYMFRPLHPGESLVHYTSDGTYTFIYCEYKSGKWSGQRKSNRYQQYVPMGTAGNPEGVYKIYHGCPPVVDYPGFSQPGSC